jgi:Bacterial self-protective colicin-like immunity
MKLLRDEQAYRRLLNDFVAQQLDARNFTQRFRKLWDCDRAEGIAGVLAMQGAKSGQAGLYGFLDSVSALCTTYVHHLPPSSGYRVSEEQFRKEVEGMVRAWPDPSQSDVRAGYWHDGQRHLL